MATRALSRSTVNEDQRLVERHHVISTCSSSVSSERCISGLRLREQPVHQPTGRTARYADVFGRRRGYGAGATGDLARQDAYRADSGEPVALQNAGLRQWHQRVSRRSTSRTARP